MCVRKHSFTDVILNPVENSTTKIFVVLWSSSANLTEYYWFSLLCVWGSRKHTACMIASFLILLKNSHITPTHPGKTFDDLLVTYFPKLSIYITHGNKSSLCKLLLQWQLHIYSQRPCDMESHSIPTLPSPIWLTYWFWVISKPWKEKQLFRMFVLRTFG